MIILLHQIQIVAGILSFDVMHNSLIIDNTFTFLYYTNFIGLDHTIPVAVGGSQQLAHTKCDWRTISKHIHFTFCARELRGRPPITFCVRHTNKMLLVSAFKPPMCSYYSQKVRCWVWGELLSAELCSADKSHTDPTYNIQQFPKNSCLQKLHP